MRRLQAKYERYGFAPVGLMTNLKFIVNRSLWKLLKAFRGEEVGFFWFEKPFRLNDVFYSITNGYYFKASGQIDFNFMGGRHECFQDEYMHEILREGSIFIDVGAHLGRFTLLGARLVGEKGMVVALEPDQRVFQRLVENVGLNNLQNVIALPIAASNRNVLALFKLSKTLRGWSSLTNMHKDTVVAEVPIPAFTLDTLVESLRLERVDLVKIDVEGAEDKVLEGAVEVLDVFRPALLIEMHAEDPWSKCRKILENYGYEYNVIHRDLTAPVLHFHIYAHSKKLGEKTAWDEGYESNRSMC